jgi:hypothetical protein
VGHYESWRFSMMSLAARDPYWSLRVRMESDAAGADGPKVEDKCLSCHASADEYSFRSEGKSMRMEHLSDIGREGVTCTVCHRIDADGLGRRISYNGGFRISTEPFIFGPHQRPFAMPMMHHTGYRPVAAKHILEAALCGTCHTLLLTQSEGPTPLVEQGTHLEWLSSEYPARGINCQTCHVPVATGLDGIPISDYIAHRPPGGAFPPTRPRSPIGVHTFIGGNVQMLRFFGNPVELRGFNDRAAATRQFLASSVALDVTAEAVNRELKIIVTIGNLAGHKLPTGLPGRRLWLHLTVYDQNDRITFESGGWNSETGELRHAHAFEVHRNTIEHQDQTPIYEGVLEDARGNLTGLFTRAFRYRKDNRLLPAGFNNRAQLPEAAMTSWIAPIGTEGDAYFAPGQDKVHYRIRLAKPAGLLRISVETCFQSIRPADAAAIIGLHRAPEVIAYREVKLAAR